MFFHGLDQDSLFPTKEAMHNILESRLGGKIVVTVFIILVLGYTSWLYFGNIFTHQTRTESAIML